MRLNELARQYHADNQHWWHDLKTGEKLIRNKHEMLMLVVSELAEAMEGERKNLMDDHLPHRKMAEVELADVIIRLLDYSGAYDIDLTKVGSMVTAKTPDNKAEGLLSIVRDVINTSNYEKIESRYMVQYHVCLIFQMTQEYADKWGYDLWAAVEEKHAYNANRADHKPAARLAAGGKAF